MTQSILLLISLPVYAVIVMTALLNPKRHNFTRRNILLLVALILGTLFASVLVIRLWGLDVYRKLYFILIQFPVFIGFRLISDYRGIKLLFTLLATVTFASIPVEFVIAARILSRNNPVCMLIGLLLSFFLVFLLIFHLRSDYSYMLKYGNSALFWKFSLIPLLFYFYAYSISGYDFTRFNSMNNFLMKRVPELIVFTSYFLFIDIFKRTYETEVLKSHERLMLMELSTAAEQLELLRSAQTQSAIYRHDLRHHMHYINTCIDTRKLSEASAYIAQIFEETDHIQVERYCCNESINLILAYYAAKAKEQNVTVNFEISTVDFTRFQIIDLCSLFSNALENALKACEQLDEQDKRYIKLRIYEKNKKLCLHISNSYVSPPVLEYGIPVTAEKEHGIGTISMIHVVEKYNGVYRFYAENENFIFQASM